MTTFEVKTLDDWKSVAQAVVAVLRPGDILGLSGPLGAGKTTFVQYLAEELGAAARPKSPTFALLRIHHLDRPGSLIKRLLHVDAYRLEKPEDLLPLNLDEELREPGTVVVIEWPENVTAWLAQHREAYRQLTITQHSDTTFRQAVLD